MNTVTVTHKSLFNGLLESLATILMLFGLAALAHCNSGCGLFQDVQAPNAKEQRYTARIVGCASTAKTKAEDHACRVGVNKEFGLCEGKGPFAGQMPGDCE